MSGFHLQIVTPEGSCFDGVAEGLRLPTTEGYVSIRTGHADYLAAVAVGEVTVTSGGEDRYAACSGGFLSVEGGAVRLLATTFEYAEEIDVERAKLAEQNADVSLARAENGEARLLAKDRRTRAINRQKVAGKKR